VGGGLALVGDAALVQRQEFAPVLLHACLELLARGGIVGEEGGIGTIAAARRRLHRQGQRAGQAGAQQQRDGEALGGRHRSSLWGVPRALPRRCEDGRLADAQPVLRGLVFLAAALRVAVFFF